MLVALITVIILVIVLRVATRFSPHLLTVIEVSAHDGETMGYIVTYLIPFLGISLDDPTKTISLAILLFVIGIVYVNSNLIHINPMLNLLGYHIFDVKSKGGKASVLISKRDYIRPTQCLNVVSLGNYILLEKKETKNELGESPEASY